MKKKSDEIMKIINDISVMKQEMKQENSRRIGDTVLKQNDEKEW